MTDTSALVLLPTYNERDNLAKIVPAVVEALPRAAVWVVDDNSPDGTGEVADRLADRFPQVRAIHRPQKAGLGTAYAESFRQALAEGYDVVVTMDADFSHDPYLLPELVAAAHLTDMVIGSRYVPGGSTPDWSLPRKIISHVGNIVARVALGLPIHDATSGYRVYSRNCLEHLDFAGMRLQGYGFMIEAVYQSHKAGMSFAERPIRFLDRTAGHSKMSRAIVIEAGLYVIRRRFADLVGSLPVHEPAEVRDHDQPAEHADGGDDQIQPAAPLQS